MRSSPTTATTTATGEHDDPDILRVSAPILVERESQKGIVIGQGRRAC